ncbi:MAG: biopolymer transporter ExbD [Leptospiraceae bacterium]|nr:biopolymer transporter ExbD [Leptospiraceae bacterium]MBK7054577.1 biopolymer transporter ExbD [Leptospiraceae bacterium]MBK9503042.1 biopolymer transporter ExbD [Leptospiraceae bacterium]MBP9162703.1 biopolymer transporter ExbD [Leptospiraceae bacterium]HRG45213.1 biopolymer transporter ExbD [Leptospiraceae bacterium]
MRYTKRKSGREHTSSMDMSSLMDIIFILLIFVMMSVSFAKNFKQIEIDLPKSETGSSEFSPDIQISVREDDKFYLEQKEISIGELSQFAANGKFSNQIVSVNVSKKVPYESFIKVLDILKQGKIKKLNLGTE